jgi:hypothetical protein
MASLRVFLHHTVHKYHSFPRPLIEARFEEAQLLDTCIVWWQCVLEISDHLVAETFGVSE